MRWGEQQEECDDQHNPPHDQERDSASPACRCAVVYRTLVDCIFLIGRHGPLPNGISRAEIDDVIGRLDRIEIAAAVEYVIALVDMVPGRSERQRAGAQREAIFGLDVARPARRAADVIWAAA